jgi:glyoxylase-like metal-dependent hydrolase (beta-lactamase superfamily II)
MSIDPPANRRDLLKLAGAASLATLGASLPAAVEAAAPMMGVLRPSIYRFKLGGFEITNFLDGFVERAPHPTYGANMSAEAVAELAKANGVSPTKFEHVYVNTLVNTGKELVLFDTGNGKGRDPNMGKLSALLVQAGYRPEQVDVVVITHGHPDHVNGLVEGDKPAFPNARYIFGEVEFDFWKKGENVREARKATREGFVKVAVPLAEKSTFVKSEGEVVGGIRAIPTFGHSPGHMAYHVESQGQRLLIWGDVSNHYIFSLQRPEWQSGADDDKDAAIATRKRVFEMVATDKLPVVGYHLPFPALGFVERAGPSYRWVPAGNQFNV